MKPAGHGVEAEVGEAEQTRVDESSATAPWRMVSVTRARVAFAATREAAVEAAEEPAEERVPSPRDSRSLARVVGLEQHRARAPGESVSELNAEMTVEIAIVSANCR